MACRDLDETAYVVDPLNALLLLYRETAATTLQLANKHLYLSIKKIEYTLCLKQKTI